MSEGFASLPAVVFRRERWSSDTMTDLASSYARALGRAFLESSRLTAVVMANDPHAVALFFAVTSGRAPVVLLSPDVNNWQTSPVLPSGTRLVLVPGQEAFVHHANTFGLDAHLVSTDATEHSRHERFMTCPGLVFFTSGSTGWPRPVYRSTTSLLEASTTLTAALDIPKGAGVIAALPLDRSYGMNNGLIAAAVVGGTVGLVERFDHTVLFDLCESGPFQYWATTSSVCELLRRAGRGAERVPDISVVAGRVPDTLWRAFRDRFGVPLRQMYGTTETLTVSVNRDPADRVEPACAGRPLPGIAVAACEAAEPPGHRQPEAPLSGGGGPDAPSPIWVRSPWLMTGYGFPPDIEKVSTVNGWWQTPDLGSVDQHGSVTILGRADDRIRTAGGHVVDPHEIASALDGNPRVRDAAVVPFDTPGGPMIGIIVESNGTLHPREVHEYLGRMLPLWKRPRRVQVVDAIPRLSTGRTDRRACAALLAESVRREPVR